MRTLLIILMLFSGLFSQNAAEIKKQIKKSGLSETQIGQLAKQRGMTDAEIDAKAQDLGITSQSRGDISAQQEFDGITPFLPFESVIQLPADTIFVEVPIQGDLRYFGYDMFQRDPAIFQGSGLGALDPGYNIGPGDEIIIMLWGETQFRQVLIVDREGFVFIPEVGQVFVNGLTMNLLESKLFKVLSQKYSSLIAANGGNPTTFLDVSLGNLRPLRILVVGEVNQPGAYQVSPATTIFTSLYYFNGPKPLGSLRDIRLIRNSKTTASIDFYDYLLSGKKMNDLRLQLDDTIFIPPRGKTVTINGEINRPAIYELKDKEGLLDLVSIAGDFTTKAHLDRIQIDRIVPAEQRKTLGMERMVIDVNMNHLQAVGTHLELLDGDTIIVFPVQDLRENYVDISGNVSRPGRYEIKEKLKVNDLVELADGIISDTYLEMAHLVRFNNDLTREMFELHLGQALQKNEQDNMVLQPHDSLIIFNKNNILNAFKSVNILGAVKSPGEYIFYDRMTINELLVQAGGFAKNVYKVKLEVMRVDPQTTSLNKFGNSLEMQDFVTIEEFGQISQNEKFNTLQPHDIVFVRADPNFKLNQLVNVTGAVTFPGEYALLSPTEHVSDLVKRAGGITQDAYPEASALIRDSIEVNIDLFNIMKNPGSNIDFNVLSGDEIHIYKHPNMVFIYGEVNNPGAYKYIPGRSVNKYINEAGGYSSKADRRDVSIRYPNGEGGEIKRFWLSPPAMDGSIITVAAETREEIDKTEMAKEITAILANLAQVIIMVMLAQQK